MVWQVWAAGDNSAAGNNHEGSCGGEGVDEVYAFRVTGDTPVCLNTVGSDVDTVLYVRTNDCAEGAEVACNDDFGDLLASQVQVDAVVDTTYFVYVDTFDEEEVGPYNLNLSIGPCQ